MTNSAGSCALTSSKLTSIAPSYPMALKIAHIDTGISLRGGQRQLLLLAEGLRALGHEQLIVCLEGSSLEEEARGAALRVFSLPAHDPGHAFGILLLRQQLESMGIQVLHAHDGRGQTVAWLASLGLPIKRVASRRVTFLPADSWTFRFKYGRTCDAVIAISEHIRELTVRAGVPADRVEVIPDGIALPVSLPSTAERERLRAAWQIEEGNFVIGQLGAFTPEKGHDVTLQAFELFAERLPQARLVLAGADLGQASETLRTGVRKWRHRMLVLGDVATLSDFLPGIDLFIMPSRAEGLGSSALWAMAFGLPVVATRVGGLPEIVAEGQSGWLIPPDSPPALAEAIVLASTDSERLHRFGAYGRTRAQEFSAGIMVARTEALYRRVLERGR